MNRSTETWRDHAIAFIATYDRPEADTYERHVVRVARRWLALMRSRQVRQGMVNSVLEELDTPQTADYGCGWDELRRKFRAWAAEEEWLERA